MAKDDPEMSYPVKAEVTVLSADEVNQAKLGWTVREYNGTEVFPYNPDDHPPGEVNRDKLQAITTKEGLKIGDTILVPGMMGGYHVMTVTEARIAKDGHTAAFLEFSQDDRACWVCTGMANMRGISKLNLSS